MKEIERRFLLLNEDWKKSIVLSHNIIQGYLSNDANAIVRVRIYDKLAFITIKSKRVGNVCDEFEYNIPMHDAHTMIGMCNSVIRKTRNIVKYENTLFEIDEFLNPVFDGLVIAEVELKNEHDIIDIPEWLGIEISSDMSYTNSELSKSL